MSRQDVVFAQSVEGLFVKGLAKQMTPALREQLRAQGLDLDRPLAASYPAADFNRWVDTAARVLHPDLPHEQALREIGRSLIRGYGETLVGRALMSLLRMLGPRKAIERAEASWRSGTNFVEVRTELRGPSDVVLHFKDPYTSPHYVAGIVDGVAAVTRARDVQVEPLGHEPPYFQVRMRWTE